MTSSSFKLRASNKTSSKVIPASFFGMHILNASPNGYYGQKQTPFHAELGFKTIRLWDAYVTWRLIQPTNSTTYDWSRMDFLVNQALAAGVDIIYTFGAPPDWVTTPHAGSGSYNSYPPNNVNDWTTFITALVARYAGKIKYYETWNEPDINFSNYFSSISQFLNLVTSAYAAIKAADPSATVLTPPISSAWIGAWSWCSQYFQAAKAGGLPHADIVSLHGYVQPNQPEALYAHVDCVRGIARNFGLSSLPIICSEFGYISYRDQTTNTLVTAQGSNMSQSQGAAYVTRMMLVAWLSGCDKACIYSFDENNVMNIPFINYPTDVNTLLKPALSYQWLSSTFVGGTLSNYVRSGTLFRADFKTARDETGVVYWCSDGNSSSISSSGVTKVLDCVGSTVVATNGKYSVSNSPIFVYH